MNIYRKKQWWKVFLLIGAIIIAFASLTYTNSLVKRLAKEESKKVQLVAEATKRLISESGDITFYHDIIIGNSTVPVILVDEGGNVITWRNLDSIKVLDNPGYLSSRLMEMKSKAKPIEIPVFEGEKQYIYFEHSILIVMLAYYPYMQLSVIGLFVVISYFAFQVQEMLNKIRFGWGCRRKRHIN